jgi:hypothetical protein
MILRLIILFQISDINIIVKWVSKSTEQNEELIVLTIIDVTATRKLALATTEMR